MTPIIVRRVVRLKAVWGSSKMIGVVSTLIIGIAASPAAGGSDRAAARQAPAGQPNAAATARHHKLDAELTLRAERLAASSVTPVIVTLTAGARLPGAFEEYAQRDGA